MKIHSLLLAGFLGGSVLLGQAEDIPLLYEPFNYAPQLLTGVTSPSGQNWSLNGTGDETQIADGNLQIPGLITSTGSCVTNGGAGAAARVSLGTPVTSGTLYYSFALRVDELSPAFATTNGFIAAFVYSTGTYGCRLGIRTNLTRYQLGVGRNPGNLQFALNLLEAGQTLFVVGSYTIVAGANNDTERLWLNPDPATFGSNAPPAATVNNNLANADLTQLEQFTFRQNGANNTPAALTFDELRIGSTWASVTPAAPKLAVSGGASGLTVTWPLAAAGYVLEGASNLTAPDWAEVSTATNGSYFYAIITPTMEKQFFRLRKSP